MFVCCFSSLASFGLALVDSFIKSSSCLAGPSGYLWSIGCSWENIVGPSESPPHDSTCLNVSPSRQLKNPPHCPDSHSSHGCRQTPDDWFVCLDNLPSCGPVCPKFYAFWLWYTTGQSLAFSGCASHKLKETCEGGEGWRFKTPEMAMSVFERFVVSLHCKPHHCLCSRSAPYFSSFSLKLQSAHTNWCPCHTTAKLGVSALCQVSVRWWNYILILNSFKSAVRTLYW